ncbi:type II toxin-antitoxin system PemK/MazF family toxin [bacterium]|nr:type II toxin-antitoxin system PemK/MazF family toxin [bacterium]MBU1995312.1 type II toxin-antitoxin system PemK/MazF family toxin [bacterium]
MSKQFKEWNQLKEQLHNSDNEQYFKERDIFWASIGINIGYEQDGKGEIFSRPVLIVKKYGKNIFFGIPLSTKIKEGSFFYSFELNGQTSSALLVQARIYDSKRLENKIGKISTEEFKKLKMKLGELLNV